MATLPLIAIVLATGSVLGDGIVPQAPAVDPTTIEETPPASEPADEPPPASEPTDEPPAPAESPPEVVPPVLLHFEPAIDPRDTITTSPVAVLLLLQIEADGLISGVEVLESGGAAFDDAAVAAAWQFVFDPARLAGEAIAVQIEYRYVFELPPADDVEPPPAAPSSPPATAPEPPPSSEPVSIDALEIDESATVRAPPLVREAAQVDLDASTAERVAGTQGDSINAVRTVGGVARPSADAGGLVVWGASPSDTRLYVDWIPVPQLFHIGGRRSIVPTPMVRSVALVPGGPGPAYGRAIGGLVRVETASARDATAERRWGTFARVDAVDVGIGADARIRDRAWVGVAVRRSLLAQTYGSWLPDSARAVVPLPTYWDGQAKAVVRLGPRDSLELLALHSHDRMTRAIPSLTPDRRFDEARTLGTHRLGARLTRVRPGGSSMTLGVWAGRHDAVVSQQFAQDSAAASQGTWSGGLRIAERRRLTSWLSIAAGLDAEFARTAASRHGAITLPAREGDVVVFGQPPGDRVASDDWIVHQGSAAGYGSLLISLAQDRWRLQPGLRIEPFITAVDRILPVRPVDPQLGRTDVELAVDPRLRIDWSPIRSLSVYTAGGRYHQAAAPEDRSARFGNPQLAASRAYHAIAGVTVRPRPWVHVDATAFYIRAERLTVRSPEPTPAVASLLQAHGQGRNVGGQLTGRFSANPSWFAWLTYSLIRAERRRDHQAAWRPFDFDQTHVLQALGSWRHATGIELGARTTVTSGNPRTAVVAAIDNAGTGDFDPVFGAHNATRLPAFWSTSARLGYTRSARWGTLAGWLDVTNVTNRRNVDEVFYTADFSQRGFVRGLPIVPSLGLEVRL